MSKQSKEQNVCESSSAFWDEDSPVSLAAALAALTAAACFSMLQYRSGCAFQAPAAKLWPESGPLIAARVMTVGVPQTVTTA